MLSVELPLRFIKQSLAKNPAGDCHFFSWRISLAAGALQRHYFFFNTDNVGNVFFVGFPSVGKSTLLTNLAGVYSEVASYEFTTLTTVPGVIRYKGAKIQLLDLPGIIEGAKDGKGRGRQVIAGAVMLPTEYCLILINVHCSTKKNKINQHINYFPIPLVFK